MSAIGWRRLVFLIAAFLLQTAFLKAALPGSDETPVRPSLVGQLLVASPEMGDPRFEHAVILIIQDGPAGAMGIVINKLIGEQPLANIFDALGQEHAEVTGDVRVFSGGPVQPEAGFVIHSPDYHRAETVAVTDRISVTSNIEILKDIASKKGPGKLLVAFGYAGWGPDQLDHEMEERAWATAEADPALVFDEDRDNVWDHAWKRRTEHSELQIAPSRGPQKI